MLLLTKIERGVMASPSVDQQAKVAAEQYEYDYNYIPPLALIKSVPGFGPSLEWAVLVVAVGLRVLVNLIALSIDQDLTGIDGELGDIINGIENRNLKETLVALLAVIVGIVVVIVTRSRWNNKCGLSKRTSKTGTIPGQVGFHSAVDHTGRADQRGAAVGAGEEFDDYKNLFNTLPLPPIADTFQDDTVFADMRVAGPNPLVIVKMTGPIAKFPVTNQQFQSVMGSNDDLDTAIAQGRVYVADYAALDWLVNGSYLTYQKYLWAPIAMFALPQGTGADRRLRPVAIQVGQRPESDNPIFTRPPPDASSRDWDKAKTAVQIADGNYHEAVSHLGQTHLVVEAFIMATNNQLSGHPVYNLLWPHFEGTLFINNAAQAKLVAPGGTVDAILSGTIDSSRVAAVKATQAICSTSAPRPRRNCSPAEASTTCNSFPITRTATLLFLSGMPFSAGRPITSRRCTPLTMAQPTTSNCKTGLPN